MSYSNFSFSSKGFKIWNLQSHSSLRYHCLKKIHPPLNTWIAVLITTGESNVPHSTTYWVLLTNLYWVLLTNLYLTVTIKNRKKKKKKTICKASYACLVCFNLWYCLRKEEVALNRKSCLKVAEHLVDSLSRTDSSLKQRNFKETLSPELFGQELALS